MSAAENLWRLEVQPLWAKAQALASPEISIVFNGPIPCHPVNEGLLHAGFRGRQAGHAGRVLFDEGPGQGHQPCQRRNRSDGVPHLAKCVG
jgi:hypothetical protein